MTIHVKIPDLLAAKVVLVARSTGKTPEDVVLDAVAQRVDPLAQLNAELAPVHRRLKELGETEDDAVEFFEEVKHEMRRQRRATGK
jgi:hypothetical protein